MPLLMTGRKSISLWRMIAWATRTMKTNVKYGPSQLLVEWPVTRGSRRLIPIPPAAATMIPASPFVNENGEARD
jgi:hypothetical protein